MRQSSCQARRSSQLAMAMMLHRRLFLQLCVRGKGSSARKRINRCQCCGSLIYRHGLRGYQSEVPCDRVTLELSVRPEDPHSGHPSWRDESCQSINQSVQSSEKIALPVRQVLHLGKGRVWYRDHISVLRDISILESLVSW